MYTVNKGPSKFVAKTRIGVPSHIDGSRDFNKRNSDLGNREDGLSDFNDMSKPVFLQIKKQKLNTYQPAEPRTPEQEEIVRYIHNHWTSVDPKSDVSSSKKNGNSVVYYKSVSETNSKLKDFVPFDFDSWLGKRLYNTITKSVP